MSDEENEAAVPQKALVYGAASFIGAPLTDSLKAGGFELEATTPESDVAAAQVVICNVYSKDAVRPASLAFRRPRQLTLPRCVRRRRSPMLTRRWPRCRSGRSRRRGRRIPRRKR